MQQVSPKETEILLSLLSQTLSVPGDVVEFGCYKGDTSILFQKLLQTPPKSLTDTSPALPPNSKKLYLYDSFAGLPERTIADSSAAGDQFKKGELFVTKKSVINKFKKANLNLPIIKKAFFKDLNPDLDLPPKIAFAFLDGDLYESIKTSLRLVAPKISPHGIIAIHDYNNPELPGATRATEEFLTLAPSPRPTFRTQETLAILQY